MCVFLRERIFPWKVGAQKTKCSHFSPFSNCHRVTTVSKKWFTVSDLVKLSLSLSIFFKSAWVFGDIWPFLGVWGNFLICRRHFFLVEETTIHANSFQYQSIIYQDQHILSVSDMIQRRAVSQCKVGYFISSQESGLRNTIHNTPIHLPRHSE